MLLAIQILIGNEAILQERLASRLKPLPDGRQIHNSHARRRVGNRKQRNRLVRIINLGILCGDDVVIGTAGISVVDLMPVDDITSVDLLVGRLDAGGIRTGSRLCIAERVTLLAAHKTLEHLRANFRTRLIGGIHDRQGAIGASGPGCSDTQWK